MAGKPTKGALGYKRQDRLENRKRNRPTTEKLPAAARHAGTNRKANLDASPQVKCTLRLNNTIACRGHATVAVRSLRRWHCSVERSRLPGSKAARCEHHTVDPPPHLHATSGVLGARLQ